MPRCCCMRSRRCSSAESLRPQSLLRQASLSLRCRRASRCRATSYTGCEGGWPCSRRSVPGPDLPLPEPWAAGVSGRHSVTVLGHTHRLQSAHAYAVADQAEVQVHHHWCNAPVLISACTCSALALPTWFIRFAVYPWCPSSCYAVHPWGATYPHSCALCRRSGVRCCAWTPLQTCCTQTPRPTRHTSPAAAPRLRPSCSAIGRPTFGPLPAALLAPQQQRASSGCAAVQARQQARAQLPALAAELERAAGQTI